MAVGLRTKLKKWHFNFSARGIYKTKLAACDPASNVIILSQLHSPDLTMYVVAAKSFARFVPPREFVLVDDGLTETDKSILSRHFEKIRFIPIKSVQTGACPKGGTWERLLSIANLNSAHYVIQLDADTLTVAPPREVSEAISQNRSFTLGTWGGRETTSLKTASEFARKHPGTHVQLMAEAAFGDFENAEQLRYVRGCSGFAGFSPGSLSLSKIEDFSQRVSTAIGADKWREWGSEQVTSNYMVANAQNPLILPVEHYPFWAPGLAASELRLIHFVGSYRFSGGRYAAMARTIIDALGAA